MAGGALSLQALLRVHDEWYRGLSWHLPPVEKSPPVKFIDGSLPHRGATNVPEPSLLPDPKDKIEEQNLLHTAIMASEDSRIEEARSAFERVLQLDPESPTALQQLGELELYAHRYALAAEYLKRARLVRRNHWLFQSDCRSIGNYREAFTEVLTEFCNLAHFRNSKIWPIGVSVTRGC